MSADNLRSASLDGSRSPSSSASSTSCDSLPQVPTRPLATPLAPSLPRYPMIHLLQPPPPPPPMQRNFYGSVFPVPLPHLLPPNGLLPLPFIYRPMMVRCGGVRLAGAPCSPHLRNRLPYYDNATNGPTSFFQAPIASGLKKKPLPANDLKSALQALGIMQIHRSKSAENSAASPNITSPNAPTTTSGTPYLENDTVSLPK